MKKKRNSIVTIIRAKVNSMSKISLPPFAYFLRERRWFSPESPPLRAQRENVTLNAAVSRVLQFCETW